MPLDLLKLQGEEAGKMKWPDLEKHERYGVAIMLTDGEISNCNGRLRWSLRD